MVEVAALTYGLLTSFVLSSASRNRKADRPNPRMVQLCGWLLVGVSTGSAIALGGYALMQATAA
ncbi:hypothetical protein [Sphingomonas fennica]|uniref:Uncharacterized protein n=1 Tax=Edaphosphingomonas fennica TaxID=114404 RepID=A0A2T4I6G0_9SPHN|nr:hypothetical protein [Sphingomonas fennica]PTD26218.1 hypothetical protein CV103_04270 [Sphingomonas fennica]